MTPNIRSTNILCGILGSMGACEDFFCKVLHAFKGMITPMRIVWKVLWDIILVVSHCV